jgi:hypothetical protein
MVAHDLVLISTNGGMPITGAGNQTAGTERSILHLSLGIRFALIKRKDALHHSNARYRAFYRP